MMMNAKTSVAAATPAVAAPSGSTPQPSAPLGPAPITSGAIPDIPEIKRQLRALGADTLDLRFPETRALAYVLHPGEKLLGIIFGRYRQDGGRLVGRGALVATGDRAFLLDKKPTYVKFDEVIYDAVSGVTYGRVWFTATVVLHTKMGDIQVRTFNQKAARQLVEAVESQIYGRSVWKTRS